MTTGSLCVTCGYWSATNGTDQCDDCQSGSPDRGLEAAIVSSAIVWRRSLVESTSRAGDGQTSALVDAVDRLLEAGW